MWEYLKCGGIKFCEILIDGPVLKILLNVVFLVEYTILMVPHVPCNKPYFMYKGDQPLFP